MPRVPIYPRAFVQVFQSTAGLIHVETHLLHNYTPPSVGHTYGQVELWDASVEEADTNMEAKLTAAADLFTVETEYNSMLWYTQVDAVTPPLLRAGKLISIPGTIAVVAGEEYQAIQVQFNFLTDTGARFKAVFMEASSRNAYSKINDYSALTTDEKALVDERLALTTPFAAQDGSQPLIWRSRTCTENNKLRKERRFV